MLNPLLAPLDNEGIMKLDMEAKAIPFKYFIPTRSQADFIKRVGMATRTDKRIFLNTSGNGAGKTTMILNIIANIVFGNKNVYRDIHDLGDNLTDEGHLKKGDRFEGFFSYPLFKNFPAKWPKNIWYISNAEVLKQVVMPEFNNWFPESLCIPTKGGKSYYSQVGFYHDKWKIFFKSDDQDSKTFEGANVSVIIFDDSTDYKLFTAAVSRMRKGGIIIIPCTPLFKASWFVDEIIDKIVKDGDKVHQTTSVWSNCIEKAGKWDLGPFGKQFKGNLTESNINTTLKNYPPEERKARETGEFGFMSGVVYRTYSRDVHMRHIERPIVLPANYMYRFIIDPHDRKPPAAAIVKFNRFNEREYLEEWPDNQDYWIGKYLEYLESSKRAGDRSRFRQLRNIGFDGYGKMMFDKIKTADPLTVKDFVGIFILMFKEIGIPQRRLRCIIDPNFGRKPNRVTGLLVHQEYQKEFAKQGYPVKFITNVVDDLTTGHNQVREALRLNVNGSCNLSIDEKCANIDWSMRNYRYDNWEGKAAEKRALKESVVETGKDFCDVLRYDIVLPFHWDDLESNPDYREGDETFDYGGDWRRRIFAERPPGAKGV